MSAFFFILRVGFILIYWNRFHHVPSGKRTALPLEDTTSDLHAKTSAFPSIPGSRTAPGPWPGPHRRQAAGGQEGRAPNRSQRRRSHRPVLLAARQEGQGGPRLPGGGERL